MSPEDAEAEIASLKVNVEQLWAIAHDHNKRFDTLQTRWWKRLWFRIDGWPGQMNLNGEQKPRPWHKKD